MSVPIAVFALLFPCQVANQQVAGWKEFTPTGSDFVVKMPAKPEKTSRTIETSQGTVRITQYGTVREGIAYMLVRTELPPDAAGGDQHKTLERARESKQTGLESGFRVN